MVIQIFNHSQCESVPVFETNNTLMMIDLMRWQLLFFWNLHADIFKKNQAEPFQ